MHKLPRKRRENAKKTRVVHKTGFVIFSLFVKQFFRISSFITDLSPEWFFDETSKEFFAWCEKCVKITTHYSWLYTSCFSHMTLFSRVVHQQEDKARISTNYSPHISCVVLFSYFCVVCKEFF